MPGVIVDSSTTSVPGRQVLPDPADAVEERAEVREQILRVRERRLDRERDRIALGDPREVGGAGEAPAPDGLGEQGLEVGLLPLERALPPVQHLDLVPDEGESR